MPRSERAFRILVVDDDPSYAKLLATLVTESGYAPPVVVGSCAEAARDADGADLILLDHQLPDGPGIELLPALRALAGRPAVILVTAHGDEALAARALRLGADDYLSKNTALPGLLPQVIERVRRNRALRATLAAAERDLVHAERLAAIGQLHVTLHHTINNPLMTAFAELTLLRDGPALSAEQRDSLGVIQDALERIRDALQRVGTLGHTHTTEYVDGVEMIDLSRRTRPMPVQQGTALVWLPDADLQRVVGMLLTHAGFRVETLTRAEELRRRIAGHAPRVVVVAGTAAPGSPPFGDFEPGPGRGYTLAALVAGDDSAARAAGADHVVPLPFDPGTFATDLLGALRD